LGEGIRVEFRPLSLIVELRLIIASEYLMDEARSDEVVVKQALWLSPVESAVAVLVSCLFDGLIGPRVLQKVGATRSVLRDLRSGSTTVLMIIVY
jgi:hypothetical protein